jgi:hypothetical protein
MEEKKEIFDLAEKTLNGLISLKSKFKNNVLGPSLINIFESVSKFNEENKNFIANLYQPYESIYDDVLSSFENPNCSCRKRVSDFIEENTDMSKNVFFSLLSFLNEKEADKILKLLQSFYDHFKLLSEKEALNKVEKEEAAPTREVEVTDATVNTASSAAKNSPLQNEQYKENPKDYFGRAFIIEKDQVSYFNFLKRIKLDGAVYNGITSVPHGTSQMMLFFY